MDKLPYEIIYEIGTYLDLEELEVFKGINEQTNSLIYKRRSDKNISEMNRLFDISRRRFLDDVKFLYKPTRRECVKNIIDIANGNNFVSRIKFLINTKAILVM